MDVNGNLNIYYFGDVTINPIIDSEGKYLEDNKTHLELIKDVKEDINLDYIIKKTASSPIMKINKIIASKSGSHPDNWSSILHEITKEKYSSFDGYFSLVYLHKSGSKVSNSVKSIILQNLVDAITRSLRIVITSCVGPARSPK
jgi:hypothetical protein